LTAASPLAAWLHPALCLTLPALLLGGGSDGLWVALLAVVAPLVARGRPAQKLPPRASLLAVAALVVAVGLLFWANLILAGDIAHWLGRPRGHGIAVAAGGGLLLALVPGAARTAPALAVLALAAVALPAAVLVRESEVGPLEAWDRVASRPAFHFSASSPWVTTGRALARVAPDGAGLVFDEEHRVSAASAGILRIRSQDGPHVSDREWEMGPGQSVTLRAGDRLEAGTDVRVRFQAGRRVPGAPVSGAAWARVGAPVLVAHVGLGMTLVGGAVAVLRPRRRPRRSAALLGGAALLGVLLWAETWAVYGALTVPELLLGGPGLARVLDLPELAFGEGPGEPYLALLVMGALGSFLASTVGLRAAVTRLGDGRRQLGRDASLWKAVFAVTGALALWPAEPWRITLLALGLAASVVTPMLLVPPRPGSTHGPLAAGLLGLALFIALILLGRFGDVPAGAGPLMAYPALTALPSAVLLGRLRR
jgi:hypothetical protein